MSDKIISDLLTFKEACKYLNLKESMVRSLVFKNKMPVIRIGKLLRFSKGDLQAWLDRQRGGHPWRRIPTPRSRSRK